MLTAQPAQEADEILQAEQSLRERRADLDELAMLLTSEHRRLHGRPAELAGGD